MKRTQKVWHSIRLTLLIALTVIAGFAPESMAQQLKNAKSLKVALLPILDAFPFYVAESEGYFVNYGVDVKAVPVASGLERDHRTYPNLSFHPEKTCRSAVAAAGRSVNRKQIEIR